MHSYNFLVSVFSLQDSGGTFCWSTRKFRLNFCSKRSLLSPSSCCLLKVATICCLLKVPKFTLPVLSWSGNTPPMYCVYFVCDVAGAFVSFFRWFVKTNKDVWEYGYTLSYVIIVAFTCIGDVVSI